MLGTNVKGQTDLSQQPTTPSFRPRELTRTANITGRVVDEDGKPVSGLNLHATIDGTDMFHVLYPPSAFGTLQLNGRAFKVLFTTGPPDEQKLGYPTADALTATRPDGSYVFENLVAAHYVVMAGGGFRYRGDLEEGNVIVPTIVETRDGETVHMPDLVVTRGTLIEGQVVDKDTGAPLPGLQLTYSDVFHLSRVKWLWYSPIREIRPYFSTKTDTQGRFKVWVTPGTIRFFVEGYGRDFQKRFLKLTSAQQQTWPTQSYGEPQIWAAKVGDGYYAGDAWFSLGEEGKALHQLSPAQHLQVTVAPNQTKRIIVGLQRLAFKGDKPIYTSWLLSRVGSPYIMQN